MTKTVLPYEDLDVAKKQQVELMFDNIAPQYDFLNRFLSLGIDTLWRKKVVRLLRKNQPQKILDMATGTADLAIETAKLNPKKIIGIDLSAKMLALGKEKIKARKLEHLIDLQQGDAENIPFDDNTFDAITVAFGVRNYENLDKGLKEMCRVLKKGGQLMVLEFSKPKKFPMKQLFNFYFKNILPVLGKMVSKDQRAYTYLPESVNAFPEGQAFMDKLEKCGYIPKKHYALTAGICSLYTAIKE